MLTSALGRLARGGFIYGLGGVSQRFIGLLLLPFFTRELQPADYGVYALVTFLSVAMTGFFNLGTANSMGILYFREPETSGRRATIVWTNFTLLSVNVGLQYALVFIAAPQFSIWIFKTIEHQELIRISIAGLAFSTLAEPWLAYLRMEQRAANYVMLTLASSLLTVVFSVWLVLLQHQGICGLVLASALGQFTLLIASAWAVARRLPFGIDVSILKPLVRIGLPSIFGLFAFLLLDFASRQLIERLLGLHELGIYSIGYSFGMIMAVVVGAFSAAWTPFFMSYVDKQEEAALIFPRVMTYYFLTFGSLVLVFFLAARPIVLWSTAPAFHEAYIVVGLVAASSMFKGCYLIALPALYYAHKLHLQSAIEWIAALTNIALNLLFLPQFGIVGAAFAAFLSYLALTVLAYAVAHRHLRMQYEWRRIASIIATVAAFCLIGSWVSSEGRLNLGPLVLVQTALLLAFGLFASITLTSRAERAWLSERFKA